MEFLDLLLYAISFLSMIPLVGFVSGDGSSGNPFVIGTPADLDDVRNDIGATGDLTYYELANDIDMSGFGTFAKIAGEAFVSFDGKGFDIIDITIDGSASLDTGFFSVTSGECLFDNITFVNPTITGDARTGVLAGDGDGAVNNCRVFGGSVNDSDGNSTFGGMFGRFSGTANNSYVLGLTINTADGGSRYGGFAGQISFGATTNKCWASVNIVENGTVTEVFGFSGTSSSGANIISCFWDTDVGPATDSPNSDATGKTTAEMQDIDTYTDINTNGLGVQLSGTVSGTASENTLSTTEDLTDDLSPGDLVTVTDGVNDENHEVASITSNEITIVGTLANSYSGDDIYIGVYDMIALGSHDGQEATAIWAIDDGNDYPILFYEVEVASNPTVTIWEDAAKTIPAEGVYVQFFEVDAIDAEALALSAISYLGAATTTNASGVATTATAPTAGQVVGALILSSDYDAGRDAGEEWHFAQHIVLGSENVDLTAPA